MLNIQIDETEAKALYIEEVKKKINEFDVDLLFWDTNELKRRTCMSWGTIQEKFFFDPRFPKHKVGGKWMFPASETKDFLLKWISEQPRS
jgi:hypothetical protein